MTRHGKNSTASAVYSYAERKKDSKQSGYGTLHERLGADSIKDFDCCSITLQPCREPVITPNGYIFDREAVLEYYLEQKKENARKLKLWEKQCRLDEEKAEKEKALNEELKMKKFIELESTPAHPGRIDTDETELGKRLGQSEEDEVPEKKTNNESVSNMEGKKKHEFPSFWVPQLLPTASEAKLQKPDQRVFCPLSGRPLKIKELMPVKFTEMPDDGEKKKNIAKKVRYMCPVTHDALTNTTRCAYLKTSQSVVTMACVENIIRKDMIDPINGKKLRDEDIIELQRGGTVMTEVMQDNFFKRPALPMPLVPLVGPKRARLETSTNVNVPSRTSNLKAPIMMLSGHEGEIYTAKFSNDGTFLASAGFDMTIFLWNVFGECENFSVLKGHIGAVMDVHFSTDSGYLFSASTDKTVRVWDMETGACIRKFKSHKDIVNSCYPARRGPQLICSGSDDGTILASFLFLIALLMLFFIHDIRKRDPVATFQNTYQITAVTFNDTSDQVIGGGIDNDLKLWDLRRNDLLFVMHGHTDTVTGLALSPDGSYVLSNAMDCTAMMWDIRPFAPEQRCVKTFVGHQHNFEKNLLKCSWAPDGQRISAGSSDRFLYVWDVGSRGIVYKLPGHQGSVNATDFHPKEPILLSAGSDKKIFLGEIESR
uniref:U5 small nuclear ribonucleoprotein 40 kDa protein n=1 Tax=Syphacia muris TaxID=451379 RepID=A0A0N5ADH4_9BILA